MITGAAIVSIVFVAGALVLALRGLQSHGLTFERKAWMAVAWIVIIAVLAFVMSRIA
ncbi:MAG: hypothetical protein KDE55_09855 [Novosphingobium sp.]|nr:hypothetical protein [Novosphingobium sp.]